MGFELGEISNFQKQFVHSEKTAEKSVQGEKIYHALENYLTPNPLTKIMSVPTN